MARKRKPRSRPPYETPPTACYLLKLPAEMKNYIYELALKRRSITWATSEYNMNIRSPDAFTLSQHNTEPPLTRVNREIRFEALPLYYAINTFGFRPTFRVRVVRVDTPPNHGCMSANQDRTSIIPTRSLGRVSQFVQYLRKIEIDLQCSHGVIYNMDLFDGTLYRRREANPYAPTEYYDGRSCIYKKRHRVEAQALIDAVVTRRRASGEGWSEAEIMRLIDIFRIDKPGEVDSDGDGKMTSED